MQPLRSRPPSPPTHTYSSELLTRSLDGYLCVWKVSDGSYVRSTAIHLPVLSVLFHPHSPTLAALDTQGGTQQVWSISMGTQHLR